MTVALYAPEACLKHDPGSGHPESPKRLRAVLDRLRGSRADVEWHITTPATREQCARVHTTDYLGRLDAVRGRSFQFDLDTAGGPPSVDAAECAAGAACAMVADLADGRARRGFTLGRPPGHHAEADHAMGFCLLNSIAIAAECAIAEHGIHRVLIIDWDVHHGNGTQHSFEDRADVFFLSTHREFFYPGTGLADERGAGAGSGTTMNIPLPAGTDDDVLLAVYENVLPEIFERFRPDLVLVSAGFDAHEHDPLGGFRITTEGFARLGEMVRDLADEYAGGRVGLVLEGGYDAGALADCVDACVNVLASRTPDTERRNGGARL